MTVEEKNLPTVDHFTRMFAGIWEFKTARKVFFAAKLGGAWRRVGTDEMIVEDKMVMKSMDPPMAESKKFTYLKATEKLQKAIIRIRPDLEQRMEAAKTLAVLLPTLPIDDGSVGSVTGRFSSKPNFRYFGADFGADYSQLELRVAEQLKNKVFDTWPAMRRMTEELKKIPWPKSTLPRIKWPPAFHGSKVKIYDGQHRARAREMLRGNRFDMIVIDDPYVPDKSGEG